MGRLNDLEGDRPVGPHLAVLQADGLVAAIPRYAIMYLIEDARRHDKVVNVGLLDVRINKGEHNVTELRFRCACGQQGCTRMLTLKGSWKGSHPQKFGSEVERLAKQVLGAKK